jgi:hypothetical protein
VSVYIRVAAENGAGKVEVNQYRIRKIPILFDQARWQKAKPKARFDTYPLAESVEDRKEHSTRNVVQVITDIQSPSAQHTLSLLRIDIR